jgi:hypothetical protein
MQCQYIYGSKEDKTYRIRCIKSLLQQIITDYRDLNILWERLKAANKLDVEINEIIKRTSWIRQALTVFYEYKGTDIEAITWAEIGEIAKDLETKENYIRKKFI